MIFYLILGLIFLGLAGYLIYRRGIERGWGKHENRDRKVTPSRNRGHSLVW